MSTFDPMATAIDWLDAYRAGTLSIVDFYTPDAGLECVCGGGTAIYGRAAITEYWRHRFADTPAGELLELLPNGDAIVISYRAPDGPVQATLIFDDEGKIARSICGPTADVSASLSNLALL